MKPLAAIAALLFVSSASAKELLLSCAPKLEKRTLQVSVFKGLDKADYRELIVEEAIPGKKKVRSTTYSYDDYVEIWRKPEIKQIPLSYPNSNYTLQGQEDLWTVSWGDSEEQTLTEEETHCTQYAPDFKIQDVSDKKMVRLMDLLKDNKVVLVNIFNTWCKPCQKETPDLVEVRSEYKEKGVEFVSISTTLEESAAKTASFAKRYGMKWPVLFDSNNDVAMDYTIHRVPATCIVKKDRPISYCKGGALTKEKLKELLDQALR
ncbi:MAG: TlpA disulfide reductase family protein [Pseudomonadota bacterium]